MDDLDKYSEITDLNFDGDNPHLAVCHKSQEYSANMRPTALLFKSGEQVPTKEIIKSLAGVVSEKEIIKMLSDNKRRSLEEALEVSMKEATCCDHLYLWVMDFSEDMVMFNYEGQTYAVAYSITDQGIVTFTGEIKHVKRRDMYVDSETGEELVKAVDWLKKINPETKGDKSSKADGEVDGETQDTPVVKEDEDNMSDQKTEINMEELAKSQAFQDLMKAQRAEWEKEKNAELEKAKLEADTKEILKSYDFVEDSAVEELTKSLLASDDAGSVMEILKAAQEKISELEKAKEDAEAEVVKVKEEFGKQDSVDAEVENKTLVKGGKKDLSSFVAKNKVTK